MGGWIDKLRDPRLVRVARWVIGLVMVWAGLAKIGNPAAFASQVHNFSMVPVAVENLIAICLPWIELVAGLAMIFGIRARAGAVVSTALLGVFTLAVAIALALGLDIECGCFGNADASRVGWVKIGQNLAMLAGAAIASLRVR